MEHPFGADALHDGIELGVLEPDGMQVDARADAAEPPRREARPHQQVEAMPVGKQAAHEIRADEAGTSGDENAPSHERYTKLL